MNNVELERAVDRYGGDLDKWPAVERAAAEALARSEPRAARTLADGARLDALLAEAVRTVGVDAALVGRIVAGAAGGRHRDVTVRPTGRLAAWAGVAMAAFLVVGFVIGLAVPDTSGDDAYARLMLGTGATLAGDVL